jgi:hypothetical protein
LFFVGADDFDSDDYAAGAAHEKIVRLWVELDTGDFNCAVGGI